MSDKYQNIRKILFIRLGAIGDVVHTTSAYQTLRQYYKNIDIDYLTSSLMQELLNNDPMLRQVLSVDDPTLDGWFRLAQRLSEERYDMVVNLQPSFKTRFFCMVLNNKHTLTYKKFKPKKGQQHIHAVENFYKTVTPMLPDVEMPNNLKLYLDQNIIKWATHKLEKENVTHAVGIVPGVSSVRRGRVWPLSYWERVVDYIANQKRLNVIIFGGTSEQEIAQQLHSINISKVRNFCGKFSIAQTAAVLSLCRVVIGSDTGPTHIASAVGPRVIGLYGATPPERSGVFGSGHENLSTTNECKFCNKRDCEYLKEQDYAPCMESITVEQVLTSLGI